MVVRASLERICFRLVLKGDLEGPADAIFRQAFRSQMFTNNPHGYDRRYTGMHCCHRNTDKINLI